MWPHSGWDGAGELPLQISHQDNMTCRCEACVTQALERLQEMGKEAERSGTEGLATQGSTGLPVGENVFYAIPRRQEQDWNIEQLIRSPSPSRIHPPGPGSSPGHFLRVAQLPGNQLPLNRERFPKICLLFRYCQNGYTDHCVYTWPH